MSFSGKRFKRTNHENVEELVEATSLNKEIIRVLTHGEPPIICFTKLSEDSYNFVLEAENKHMTVDFKLNEEVDMKRRDGQVVKITYTMISENILKQTIKLPDGKLIYFVREFYDKEAKMIVSTDESEIKAVVYFEQVE